MRRHKIKVLDGGGVRDWRPPLAVGDAVCVRAGTPDPDFPGKRLDDWTGVIAARNEAVAPTRCLIQWDENTVDGMSDEYRVRCAMEDLALDQMWLSEDDLYALPDCAGMACGVGQSDFRHE